MTVALMILAAILAVPGAGEATGDDSAKTPPVPVKLGKITPITLGAGSASTITIPITIAEGHRVQANPASNEFLVPLEIILQADDGIDFRSPTYPPGLPYRLEGTEEDLNTYVEQVEITVPISAASDAEAARHQVSGELRYQACNSRTCLFPATLPVVLEIDVVPSR
jgi:hypothetical protein